MKQTPKLTAPIQPIEAEGWMMNDESTIVKIDQYYIDPRKHLIIHAIDIEEGGDKDCYLGWYDCYADIQMPPRLYSTFDECKKQEEAIRNFEDAKEKAEEELKKKKISAELDKYDYYDIKEYLEKNHGVIVATSGEYGLGKYEEAIKTFRRGYITIELTSGKTNVSLDSIDYVQEKDDEITVTTKSGFSFHSHKGDMFYPILYLMYIKDIYSF